MVRRFGMLGVVLLGACLGGGGGGGAGDAGGGDGDASCEIGAEGCPCTSGGHCDDPLSCRSELCVDLTGGGDGDGDTAGGDGDGDTAGGDGDGDTAGGDGDGDTAGGDGDGDGDVARCGEPLMIVVDASGSMGQDFDGVTRWQAIRDALVGAGGTVETYGSRLAIGLLVYHSDPQQDPFCGIPPFPACVDPVPGQCLVADPVIDPAPNQFAGIETAYPLNNVASSQTPTGLALELARARIATRGASGNILLVSDGVPNGCFEDVGPEDDAYAAARGAAAAGVRTYVVGVDPNADVFLQQLASAGSTVARLATTQAELGLALDAVVRQLAVCQ